MHAEELFRGFRVDGLAMALFSVEVVDLVVGVVVFVVTTVFVYIVVVVLCGYSGLVELTKHVF